MTLPNTIQDTYSAGQEWLKQKVAQDEANLFDRDRPLLKMKRSPSLFQTKVAQYGFARTVIRYFLP